MPVFRFSFANFIAFIVLFAVEAFIAVFVKDDFVRPYLGDVLVVILLYFLVLSFVNIDRQKLIIGIFLFACFVEYTQHLNLIGMLGLEKNKLAESVIGRSFAWEDILCYFAGCLAIFICNMICKSVKRGKQCL